MLSPDLKKGLREMSSTLVNRMPEKIEETFREHGFKGLLPATHIQIWVASATKLNLTEHLCPVEKLLAACLHQLP